MISFEVSGSFDNTESFLKKAAKADVLRRVLSRFGAEGVSALASATPVDSGLTADLWDYEIRVTQGSASITWTNSNLVNGTPVAILLQYGHGTGTGGYVQGRDFINPAIKPLFERIADEVWKEVTK